MVDTAKVMLYGKRIGTFRWNDRYQVAQFEYDKHFIGDGIEPSPLMMPVQQGRVYSFGSLNNETYKGLPGLLADSLPDTYGRALFDKWLSITGRQSGNAIETLCFLGKRCMGALEFEPAIEVKHDETQRIEIDALIDVARSALDEKQNFTTNISDDKRNTVAEILRLGTSAGGQRAKAIIAYNKTTGEIRSGQVEAPRGFDYYLIKLDGVSANAGLKATDNYGRLEYSFYKLVKECGIDMAECSLIEENGRAHFLTKRFDREDGKKIHMQTLCGIAHYDYRLQHGYSYEQAFNVMRALRLPYSQAQEMFKRMTFNVAIRNQNDHTKNISFLMDESGKWRLSPAYDVNYAYNPNDLWTATHQMSVNNKYDNINRNDLMECAKLNNIKDAKRIIDQVCDVVATWPRVAQECGIPQNVIDEITPNLCSSL